MKRLRLPLIVILLGLGAIPPTAAAAQLYSARCFTQTFWCMLPSPAPVGSLCYCASPYGPVQGKVG